MDIWSHVLEFLGACRCGFDYHCPVVVTGSNLGPIRRYVESCYLGWLSRRVNRKASLKMLWRRTIRGLALVFGEVYVLFGTVTLAFAMPN